MSDVALETIKQFAQLTSVAVGTTMVTEKGVKDLAKALPRCEITWNDGTIKPK